MSSTSTHGRKTHDAATAFSAAQASVLVNAVLIGVMIACMGWALGWNVHGFIRANRRQDGGR